jgi:hypothetical protein
VERVKLDDAGAGVFLRGIEDGAAVRFFRVRE